MSYSTCSSCAAVQPKSGADLTCRNCCERIMDAPRTYPQGPLGAELDLGADLDKIGCLYHDKEIQILNACFYKHEGANLVRLGEGTQLQYTTQPEDLNSDLFTFRFRKYPLIENSARDNLGRVIYQSRGPCIREGDNLTMDNVAVGRVLTHDGYVTPWNTPFVNVPYRDAIENFDYMGTKSYENIRLISESFDPEVPLNDQPLVRVDGKKKYYIQFTRTGQFLSLVPGMHPAPCLLKTQGYMGPSTSFIFLDKRFAFESRANSQKEKMLAQQRAALAEQQAQQTAAAASAQ